MPQLSLDGVPPDGRAQAGPGPLWPPAALELARRPAELVSQSGKTARPSKGRQGRAGRGGRALTHVHPCGASELPADPQSNEPAQSATAGWLACTAIYAKAQ